MSIWMNFATVIVALGLIALMIMSVMEKGICIIPLFYTLGALFGEGIVYLLVKLAIWVFGWHAALMVKVFFLMVPASLILGVLFFEIAVESVKNEWVWASVSFAFLSMFIPSGLSSAFLALGLSLGWNIAVLGLFWLICIVQNIGFVVSNRPHGVSYGDHAEIVSYTNEGDRYNDPYPPIV